jgi:hypothetical protein
MMAKKNYYRRKTSRSKRNPIANQGLQIYVGAQPTSLFGLGRDLISYGKTNADGRFNWHFRRETMK